MFSGIIETTGIITDIKEDGSNKHFTIESSISHEAYIDQSISHNGVCLTVISTTPYSHTVTAIKETMDVTNLSKWQKGDIINLERSVLANSRIDGHFVQGHVDTALECIDIREEKGSWYFYFRTSSKYENLMVPKGSICVNGVSLTLVNVNTDSFSVAIIPYTYEHTNFKNTKPNDLVNIEFDILGKYIVKYIERIRAI